MENYEELVKLPENVSAKRERDVKMKKVTNVLSHYMI